MLVRFVFGLGVVALGLVAMIVFFGLERVGVLVYDCVGLIYL